MNTALLYQDAQELIPSLIAWRRSLHQQPELSGQELKTGAFLIEALESLGIAAYRVLGQMAIVASIQGYAPGRIVALRADMDALPIQEIEGRAYGSTVPGVMHACGHDAHMAIQLGAAAILASRRSEWQGTVCLLFEPAEETDGGAQALVDAGYMEGVHAAFALHMQPGLLVGQLQTRPGAMSGYSDDLTLTILGSRCHGAYPEKGVDAIVLAAQVISALQTLISRNVSPLDSAVLSFGRIEGGTAANVVADKVVLRGTLRTLRSETRSMALEGLERMAQGICEAMGGACRVEIRPGYHAVMCAPHWFNRLNALAQGAGIETLEKETPSLGVDSFGDLTACAPGLYYDLGCAATPDAPPIHTDAFDVDEACLPLGAYLQAALALDALA